MIIKRKLFFYFRLLILDIKITYCEYKKARLNSKLYYMIAFVKDKIK